MLRHQVHFSFTAEALNIVRQIRAPSQKVFMVVNTFLSSDLDSVELVPRKLTLETRESIGLEETNELVRDLTNEW